ncbi:bifunctional RNase H/acid phosphatase [Kibdelosporangium phytohabitans]|uniref:bifunctional RNase H/acid phosphatase n=1 Tax=Kibdelosporangium phytohabitans TaxID=860235 RepID=UPI000A3F2BC2|nr:bifunctional RNase H/acid phosphatase [Kibdelosporangium phytohabitans]MBE1468006.1 putative phosphoglycerate mutase [Kibdelosporangium phytohabitans]
MKVVVEADGGSRGNPGPAGYGAVVRDAANGELLAERAEGIGVATNNVAEYGGLIAGLQAAASVGADEVEVRMDSKLVVEQMSGRWQIKHPSLQPLAAQARTLAAGFDRVTYSWIPRERNKEADRLANEAMDAQAEPRQSTPSKWTGAKGTPTRFLLVRHGQTPLSVERRYSGRGDVALTPLGEQQALAAATRLSAMDVVDSSTPIVSSPLGRAKQTAQAIADATSGAVDVHTGLTETDFGSWEGLTFAEAAERDSALHSRWLSDPSIPAPGGESFDEVHRRVRKVRDELVSAHEGKTVVVVSHVTPIKSLLRLGLDAGPALLFRLHLDLASLSIVEFYPDGNASVRLVNDISHHPRS